MDKNPEQSDVNSLLVVVVQAQDAERTENALLEMGQSVARLPSTGGFLGNLNSTLLIYLNREKRQNVYDVLHENCHTRLVNIAVPLESTPLPLSGTSPIRIGGANIFELAIEHYEEF